MNPDYSVIFLPAARDQLKRLRDSAAMSRLRGYYAEAARVAVGKMESLPHQWGDPLRKTAKPGGQIYRGLSHPLHYTCAVYEPEKQVLVISIAPLPGFGPHGE